MKLLLITLALLTSTAYANWGYNNNNGYQQQPVYGSQQNYQQYQQQIQSYQQPLQPFVQPQAPINFNQAPMARSPMEQARQQYRNPYGN